MRMAQEYLRCAPTKDSEPASAHSIRDTAEVSVQVWSQGYVEGVEQFFLSCLKDEPIWAHRFHDSSGQQ